jgi:hypothetical protein
MATNTPKLNLVKPDLTDNVDISVLNGNMDILDDALTSIPTIDLDDLDDVTITTPTTGQLLRYDGTDWKNVGINAALGAGKILQVVSTIKDDTFTTTSTTFQTVTGLTAAITPTFTSSKIYVVVAISVGNTASSNATHVRLSRGATPISLGASAGSRTPISGQSYIRDGAVEMGNVAISFLDSPNTTSSTTYSVELRSNNSGQIATVNRSATDSDAASTGRSASNIILMEVAG